MLKTMGALMALAIVASLAETGALNELGDALSGLIQPVGITFSGIIEGASKNSDKIEAIVCQRGGTGCRVEEIDR